DAVGLSGGTLLMWDSSIFARGEVLIGTHYVCVISKWNGVTEKLAVINIYGPQESRQKEELWLELESLINSKEAIWILFGDFNMGLKTLLLEVVALQDLIAQMDIEGFDNVIESSWNNGVYRGAKDIVLKNKLKQLRMDIKKWSRDHVALVKRKKNDILNWLVEWDTKAEEGCLTSTDRLKHEEYLMDLNFLEQKERDSLMQKIKVKQAAEGDENTKFFHSRVNKNNGDDVTLLESNFTMDEIKTAVWDCCSSKSSVPDGFNFKFIKSLARGCNASFITLIPKKADPLELSDYRPISLIGSMYKILSKVLAARLSRVIHKLISPNQTAFLKGRQILDGCLIANEIINFAKSEKINMLLFKVDFEKAFDSVNWEFLFDIMAQMSFGSKWRKWISSCLSSASVSVLINGSLSKEFKMERGLRQGDPLSPFLFLIVAEALQIMIIEACNKGIFKGLSLGDDGSNISLLQLADDALFFGEWSKSNVRHLIHILDCFHDVSGLKINLDKSRLFGIEVSPEEVSSIARSVNCSHGSLPFIYLGLPVGRTNMLSIGGRLTLVKSVLGTLPLYYLSLFKAPTSVIFLLESIRRRFFWGFKDNETKMVWVSWQKIMSSTKNGGLGVESIKAKNMGLMGKWKWHFLNESGALWRRVIVELHGVNGGFNQTTRQGHNSGTWANIVKSCFDLEQMGVDM
ncbi:RNA-directed DNA polymerase, eukaryota, reverse transcriptase zinc-binding domain protein, partial [Tanacetum coccineum]